MRTCRHVRQSTMVRFCLWGLVYSAFLLQVNRELGEMCTYSHDCQSGCCQLERLTKIRSCQSKALLGEKCTNAQVKADTYVDACPCVSGYGKCCLAQECLPMLPLTDGHFSLHCRLLLLSKRRVHQMRSCVKVSTCCRTFIQEIQ